MKSILLPITANIDSETITEAASNIALRFRSSLTGLFVRPDPRSAIPFMGEGLTAEMIQTLCDNADRESNALAGKAKEAFCATMDKVGIKFFDNDGACDGAKATWLQVTGQINDHVGRRARTADMAICLQPSSKTPDSEDIFLDLIFRSGRSVLMVPKGFQDSVGRHVMIAWNGRTEGARAVAGALPLLVEAEKVTIVQIGEIDEDRPCVSDIARYLGEHCVNAETEEVERTDKAVGAELLSTAQRIGADTVVLGAYSHSRWREMVLGGVTRYITAKSTLPVFMSH